MKLTHLQVIAEYLNQFDYITKARRVGDNTIELGFRSQELGVRVREQSVGAATPVADDYATEITSPRSKTVGRGVPTPTNEPDNLEAQDSSLSGWGHPDLHDSNLKPESSTPNPTHHPLPTTHTKNCSLLTAHCSLFTDLTRGHSTIYIAPSLRPQQGYNAPFDSLLNTQVSKAKLLKVETPPNDRMLRFHLAPKSSYKDRQIVLQLEFTGRNTNAILLDENGVVIEALRHIDSSRSYRVVQPGVELADLPSRGLTSDDMSQSDLSSAGLTPLMTSDDMSQSDLSSAGLTPLMTSDDMSQSDLSSAGLTPLMQSKTVGRGVPTPTNEPDDLKAQDSSLSGWGHPDLHDSTLKPESSTPNPTRYNEIQRVQVIHDLSLQDKSQITRPLADIENLLIENYRTLHAQKLEQSKKNKISATKKQIAKFDRLLKKLSDPKKLLEQSEKYQNIANIVLANLHKIKPYDKVLRAEDFDGNQITIELPANVPVGRLGEYFFNLSKRAKAKAQNVHIERENLESKKLFYENILNAIEVSTDLHELDLLVPKRAKAQRKKEKIKEGELFWIEDYKVIVGRNSVENQHLLKLARANDIWMHVRNIPSSHVIIRTDKQNLPESVLQAAAKLCVDFSLKQPGDYDVDYTKRKFVKIQEGSNVEYDKYQTIRVRKEGTEIRE